jgi:hypothetical protein
MRVLATTLALTALSGVRVVRAQQIQVAAGVTMSPDTVRVGDPFRVTVGIRAPKGATIVFPRATDSTSTVQSLDPVSVRTSADTGAVEQYADYRVAAWDVGAQEIHLDDVVVQLNGRERHISLTGNKVFVRSVLPVDSAQRVPKPPRALFETSLFPWWIYALIAAAIIGLGLLVWWWIRRRRRPKEVRLIDPFERATSEFDRIEKLGLVDAGERGRYVTLMIEVLRDYLSARYAAEAALSLTSMELQRATMHLPFVPQDRLTRLLTEADLIKFARRPVSGDRAREIGREARAIVEVEHKSSQPTPEQVAAQTAGAAA